MQRLAGLFSGADIAARTRRGSLWTVVDFGGNQFLRLASNLLLTRLLFPEAFGLMAIVQVFITGLEMFSDAGVQSSIIQNKRGPIGTFNPSTNTPTSGYTKDYHYDPRMAVDPPPFFPTTGEYDVHSWQEK